MPTTTVLSVPVYCDETAGIDRRDDLLLGGIPLPRGAVTAPLAWQLRSAHGRSTSVIGTPAAYWPDGSIKWLHVCGAIDLAGGQRNRFVLEASACKEGGTLSPLVVSHRGADEAAPSTAGLRNGLTASSRDSALHIRGGPLALTLRDDATRLAALQHNGHDVLAGPGLSARLVLQGPDGEHRRAFDLQAATPELVVQGAERMVARVPGRFVDEAGRCVGELILFLEVYRQVPEVRLQPVFIYLGFAPDDLVAELTLTAHLVPGAADRYALGGEAGAAYSDVVHRAADHPRWPQARVLQTGSSFFRIQKRTGPDGSWVKAVEGRRSDGWCHLAGPTGGVTAACRYVWQEYPRALTLDTDAGTLAFGLVPAAAEPLDLRRYSPTNFGMTVYETGNGPYPQATHGATGIAKASELLLRFHAPGEADAPQRGRSFTHPCRLLPEPAWFVSSGVAGHIALGDPSVPESHDGRLARIADFMVNEREVRGWYGLMDFGDIMECYEPARGQWAFDLGGYAWLNSEALPDLGLFLSGLRSGRSDWVEAALEMSRHIRDVDTYHRGELKGVGSRHHINHWGDKDKEWRISMPYVRRLHYYLTADPWTAETIRNTVAVYQSYERTAGLAPSMASALAGLYAKWEMSGNAADGHAVRNLLDAYAASIGPDGQFRLRINANLATGVGAPAGEETMQEHYFLTTFGGQHVLVELAELLGHAALSDGIVRFVRWFLGGVDPRDGARLCLVPGRRMQYRLRIATIAPFLAHACRHTGDAALAKALTKVLHEPIVDPANTAAYGDRDQPTVSVAITHDGINKVACEFAATLHLLPYALAPAR